jgi:hypothetical protein
MRRWLYTLGILAAILLGMPARAQDPGPVYKDQIVLPIEVVGANGFTEAVSCYIPSATASQADKLYLQIENLDYETMGSVKLNSGSFVALNNTNCVVYEPGKSYAGIGGSFSVLKMTVALSELGTLSAGTNTLTFKFNTTDGVSSGYRVIGINLLGVGGDRLLPASVFRWDDINKWSPPFSDAPSIAAGRTLWSSAALHENPGGAPINAKCSDCHARDGRDLKYYNFSNKSIIARSEFHGLTNTQGKQIASYIRTLPTKNPGRPWNPPFQPGPGLDSKPIDEWAAGAGIQWALDRDGDTLPYLYPNGVQPGQHDTYTTTLNLREIPIAFQFLSWNHWLPRYWPGDSYPTQFNNSVYRKRYDGSGGFTFTPGETDLRSQFTSFAPTDPFWTTGGTGMLAFLTRWELDQRLFLDAVFNAGLYPTTHEESEHYYAQKAWQSVKIWELNMDFRLFDYGDRASYFNNLSVNSAEKRTFPTGAIFFNNAPHKQGVPTDPAFCLRSPVHQDYINNQWYILQPTIDGGNRARGGNNPTDWAYTLSFMLGTDNTIGSGLLHCMLLHKAMEMGDNNIGPSGDYGWNPINARVKILWMQSGTFYAHDLPPSTFNEVRCAETRQWLKVCQKFTRQQYIDGGIMTNEDALNLTQFGDGGTFVTQVYTIIWLMVHEPGTISSNGVDARLVNDLVDYGVSMWPDHASDFLVYRQ